MAIETNDTAHTVHAYSFSIVAVFAGLLTALALFAVLLFVNYNPRNDFDASATTQSNASKNGEAPQ